MNLFNHLPIIAMVAIVSMIIFFLVSSAYGYTDSDGYQLSPRLENTMKECVKTTDHPDPEFVCRTILEIQIKLIVEAYCKQYEGQGVNVINVFVDKGYLNPTYRNMTCSEALAK